LQAPEVRSSLGGSGPSGGTAAADSEDTAPALEIAAEEEETEGTQGWTTVAVVGAAAHGKSALVELLRQAAPQAPAQGRGGGGVQPHETARGTELEQLLLPVGTRAVDIRRFDGCPPLTVIDTPVRGCAGCPGSAIIAPRT
jgi:hypothetical protein